MTTQLDNKALIRRLTDESFNNGNLAIVDELYATREAIEGKHWFIPALRTAFPDLVCTIEDIIEEGDRLALRATMSGTHAAEWDRMPATGRKISWALMVIMRMQDGKIVEEWVNSDRYAVVEQLTQPVPVAQ